MPAPRMNHFRFKRLIDLAAQIADVDIHHIAGKLLFLVVEVLLLWTTMEMEPTTRTVAIKITRKRVALCDRPTIFVMREGIVVS